MMTLRHKRRIERHRIRRKKKRLALKKARGAYRIRLRNLREQLASRPKPKDTAKPEKKPAEKAKGFHPIAMIKKILNRRGK
jgi:hypothetical protein